MKVKLQPLMLQNQSFDPKINNRLQAAKGK